MPGSLRNRLFLLIFLVAGIPILFTGYLTARTSVNAMVAEKQQKLFGATHFLDRSLHGSYVDILRRHKAEDADRATKIDILNAELSQVTDDVARAYPGIGVGYYSLDLDAIITYGPSKIYADKVGLPISESHQGRLVMATGIPRVQEGNLVRGQIMNAMHPLVREGRVIGYAWANELTVNITAQINAIVWQIAGAVLISLIMGSIGVAKVTNYLATDVEGINFGVRKIREDLSYRLQPLQGEIGEIATAINEMAQALQIQQRREEQVQRADRLSLIGEMASGIAHEIRNPLMAVKGFAQLQGEDTTAQERKEYNEIIVREVDRMNQLIEQLLFFSRPTVAYINPVNISHVLDNTLMLVKMQTKSSHMQFVVQTDSGLPLIMANEEQLEQVFLNILLNAIQSMNNEGLVKITARYCPLEQQVCVSFADSGAGIAPEILDRLFDPFFTTKATGTGLGLSVAKHIMEIWGGKITVESELNNGSVFTLSFPVTGGEVDADNRPDEVSANRG
jgi:two-component system sensor histidine kinase HydH